MSSAAVSRRKAASKEAGPYNNGRRKSSSAPQAGASLGSSTSLPATRSGQLDAPDPFRTVPARPGDHHLIHGLLISVLHQPSPAEFQAEQEDPFYEPADRLLVKRGPQIAAHAHLIKRQLRFGSRSLPVAIVSQLAVAPEFHEQDCPARLLHAAEQRMVDDGAVLGLLRTRTPELFLPRGWCVCLRHSYSMASARRILSHLREEEARWHDPLRREPPPLNIRIWRHVEQAALVRLHNANTQHVFGPLVRSEPYWRWLISRRAYDRIYVAIDGPDKIELDDAFEPIVGYAVMKEGRILELVTAAAWRKAAAQLLARACHDAIEQDLHDVRLDAPPIDPLHCVLAEAGGERFYHEAQNGEVFMLKLFDPLGFLRLLEEELHQRAKNAHLSLPADLGLHLDGEKYSLAVRPRSIRLVAGKLGRSYLECGWAELTQLLLGHLDVPSAVQAGRLHASTRVAQELAEALFPQLPIWRPPWDELPA